MIRIVIEAETYEEVAAAINVWLQELGKLDKTYSGMQHLMDSHANFPLDWKKPWQDIEVEAMKNAAQAENIRKQHTKPPTRRPRAEPETSVPAAGGADKFPWE